MRKLKSIFLSALSHLRVALGRVERKTFVAVATALASFLVAAAAAIEIVNFFANTDRGQALQVVVPDTQISALSGGKELAQNGKPLAYGKGIRAQLHLLRADWAESVVVNSLDILISSDIPNDVKEIIKSEPADQQVSPYSYAGSRLVENVYAVTERQSVRIGYQTKDSMEVCPGSNLLECGAARVLQLSKEGDQSADFKINIAHKEKDIVSIIFRATYFYDGESHVQDSRPIYLFN